jgi:hypothetical protein
VSRAEKGPRDAAEDARRTAQEARMRPCLRCATPFESAWSGERICRRCKASATWRQGLPHASSHGRRR